MSRAIANALIIALMDEGSMDIASAREFATEFVEANAELFSDSAPVWRTVRQPVAPAAPVAPAPPVFRCPNCHEPVNDHMPNCARATGVDPRAVTAVHHLRVDGPPPSDS